MLEVPNSALGAKPVGVWARTLDNSSGSWVQAERGARPPRSRVSMGSERGNYKCRLLGGRCAVHCRICAFGWSTQVAIRPEEAVRVASTLLPDIMHYDPANPASFPKNGRTLTDDAADAFIAILTNGKITDDRVGPHRDIARLSLCRPAPRCLTARRAALGAGGAKS